MDGGGLALGRVNGLWGCWLGAFGAWHLDSGRYNLLCALNR